MPPSMSRRSRIASARAADEPFDNPSKADLVIRSSDKVEFYVYKRLLARVSIVFEDMFSLAQPSVRDESQEIAAGTDASDLPFIDVSETSGTLSDLLAYIDPRVRSLDNDIDDDSMPWLENVELDEFEPERVYNVVCAADKYQMEDIFETTMDLLRDAAQQGTPAEVFLLVTPMAVVRDWAEEIALLAAKASLEDPFETLAEYQPPRGQKQFLKRLKRYHKLCGRQVKPLLPTSAFKIRHSHEVLRWARHFPSRCSNCRRHNLSDGQVHWFTNYMRVLAQIIPNQPLAPLRVNLGLFDSGSEGDFDSENDFGPVLLRGAEARSDKCMKRGVRDFSHEIDRCHKKLENEILHAVSRVDLGFRANRMPFVRTE